MREAILFGEATFVIDRFFYPDKSHLVAARWRCSYTEILLAIGNFRFSVDLQYYNPYTAKLCSCLFFIKFINWILDGSRRDFPISVITRADCASVINRLTSIQLVTSFSTFLHQVVREIWLMVRKLNLWLHPIKIKAHLDDHLE